VPINQAARVNFWGVRYSKRSKARHGEPKVTRIRIVRKFVRRSRSECVDLAKRKSKRRKLCQTSRGASRTPRRCARIFRIRCKHALTSCRNCVSVVNENIFFFFWIRAWTLPWNPWIWTSKIQCLTVFSKVSIVTKYTTDIIPNKLW
jgi:hypothetical protein